MATTASTTPPMRKTRIVCISDTHNQTPKLPKGDVLIHAGDLTNQGSYSELKKSVEWLKKTDFEAKIVVSGNHDITLDAAFYEQHGTSWKWPEPQDSAQCRKLFEDSQSITYLENQAACVYLTSATGPHTCFKVFGSPCTPKVFDWAFQYEPQEAPKLWNAIPSDTDIVITHTPPKGHCDNATKDDRSGCEVLFRELYRVRPLLSVFGHIHEARGVERVRWNDTPENGCLVEEVEVWQDPGFANNKQSLVNLTDKGGRPLDNSGALQSAHSKTFSLAADARGGPDGGQVEAPEAFQPDILKSTSRLKGVADSVSDSEARAMAMSRGAIVYRQAALLLSDIGLTPGSDVEDLERRSTRRETVMINAAFLGPRIAGRPKQFNKPIVVDVDLPVWSFDSHAL